MWIGNDLRDSMVWAGFEEVGRTALDALDEATKNLTSLVETVAEEKPDLVTDVADGQRRMRELLDGLRHILDGAGFEEVGRTALDALDEATKNLTSLVETVAEEKPDLVTDVADGQRRMRELLDGLRHILDGADDRYV